jgi:hypothetical protein
MDTKTLEALGAIVGPEQVTAETADTRTTQTEIALTPQAIRNIIANDALANFAHSGYKALRAIATQLGFRIDESALRLVFINFMFAAVQDAVHEAAVSHPDASALGLRRFAADLRARFASAIRAAMRDDAQEPMIKWAANIPQAQLDAWRQLTASTATCPPTPEDGATP